MKTASPEGSSAVIRSALAIALERAGGTIEFTETEFAAIQGKHGRYVITTEVDRSKPGEPVIRVAIEPAPGKPSDPVM